MKNAILDDEDEGSQLRGWVNPGGLSGRKSNVQRKPSGNANNPDTFPSKYNPVNNAFWVT